MLFCYALLKVLSAISAVLMAHEAVRATGVDLFGYVLQTLDIAPSSTQFFRDLVHRSPLEAGDIHSETLFVMPMVLHQEVEETVSLTVNTTTTTEYPEPEESVKELTTISAHPEPEGSDEHPTSHLSYGTTPTPGMC